LIIGADRERNGCPRVCHGAFQSRRGSIIRNWKFPQAWLIILNFLVSELTLPKIAKSALTNMNSQVTGTTSKGITEDAALILNEIFPLCTIPRNDTLKMPEVVMDPEYELNAMKCNWDIEILTFLLDSFIEMFPERQPESPARKPHGKKHHY
jgi:hypothetical protein